MSDTPQMKPYKEHFINIIQHIWIFLKKKYWYLILLSSSSIYVWSNKLRFHNLSELSPRSVIFFIWIALLLLPLFSEFEFMGIKFKKTIEKANAEIKENIHDLKIQMLDLKVSNSAAATVNITGNLPTQTEMKILEKSIPLTKQPQKEEIPKDKPVYLLKIRMDIEQRLKEIYNIIYPNSSSKIHLTRTAQDLLRAEVINRVEYDLIFQTIQIANNAVHGEKIEDAHISFVQNCYPTIISTLKRTKSDVQKKYK